MLLMQYQKVRFYYVMFLDKNAFYNTQNAIDFTKFPIEILIEIVISFLCVTMGSLFEYAKFEEIYFDNQPGDKKAKHFNKPMFNYLCSKGGMLNHYLKNSN